MYDFRIANRWQDYCDDYRNGAQWRVWGPPRNDATVGCALLFNE